MTLYFRYRFFIDFAVSAIITVVLWNAPKSVSLFRFPTFQEYYNIAIAMLGTSASLLGFVLTASTFLISHLQNERFHVLRGERSYRQLTALVASNLWRLLILTGFSAATLLLVPSMFRVGLMLAVFATCWTATALIALIWVIIRIYSIPLAGR